MTDATFANITDRPGAAWGAVLSMSLSVAMLIAAESMPVTVFDDIDEALAARYPRAREQEQYLIQPLNRLRLRPRIGDLQDKRLK